MFNQIGLFNVQSNWIVQCSIKLDCSMFNQIRLFNVQSNAFVHSSVKSICSKFSQIKLFNVQINNIVQCSIKYICSMLNQSHILLKILFCICKEFDGFFFLFFYLIAVICQLIDWLAISWRLEFLS